MSRPHKRIGPSDLKTLARRRILLEAITLATGVDVDRVELLAGIYTAIRV